MHLYCHIKIFWILHVTWNETKLWLAPHLKIIFELNNSCLQFCHYADNQIFIKRSKQLLFPMTLQCMFSLLRPLLDYTCYGHMSLNILKSGWLLIIWLESASGWFGFFCWNKLNYVSLTYNSTLQLEHLTNNWVTLKKVFECANHGRLSLLLLLNGANAPP